ncbi:MAG: FUN14 domain-containing protein, partial [Halobacteriales archaeon]
IGAQLALFKFLETRGVLEVNWEALYTGAANTTTAAANATMGGNSTGNASNTTSQAAGGSGLFESLLSMLPVGGGFTAGALIGFKKG